MSQISKPIFMDPGRKLVDVVVAWLCRGEADGGLLRTTAEGVRSLEHVLVVVPTAQSGRQLRLGLARHAAAHGWGGVTPPRVALPMQLIRAADNSYATASKVQLGAAFLKFVTERPRRQTVGGKTVLMEWNDLFRPDYIADVRSHLSFLDQLNDIWRILAGGGLLMRDVAVCETARTLLASAQGDELARWQQLGEFETAFFDFLHACGLRHEVEGVRLAKTSPEPLPSDIDAVVLPGLVDPVSVLYDVLRHQRDALRVCVLIHAEETDADRFDSWGRPRTSAWIGKDAPVVSGIRNADVVRAATDVALAKRIAADFPPADSDQTVPSLGLCDTALFPELSAAFLNAGYQLHNPERHVLSASSLGRIVDNLIALYQARAKEFPWAPLVSLLRENDVIGPVLNAVPKDEHGQRPGRRAVLEGIDICRNAFLPRTLPASCDFDESRLQTFERRPFAAFRQAAQSLTDMIRAALAEVGGASVGGFVRAMLVRLYTGRGIGTSDGEREFRAAAQAVRDVLVAFDDAKIAALGLTEGALVGLFRKTVAESAYSLEPDSHTAVRTEGWLELAWSDADKVALAGFNEGAVPDSVMGHAFLPDSLRAALGLTSNEQRLARDTYLLKALLASRASAPGSVRAYLAQTGNTGDIHRPSRLLFLVRPEDLAARTARLFGELPPGDALPGRVLTDGWRPNLPDEVAPHGKSDDFPEGRLSASAIDSWLKCPFTYLFQYGLAMRRVEEKDELEANDFGTLVHRALEIYALEQLERTEKGLSQLHEAEDIAASFVRIMESLRRMFGEHQSVNLRLQLEAAAGRLKCFARLQAKWAQEGWNVVARPEYGFVERPFEGEPGCDVAIKGSVDRIDYKDGVGFRIIDYKTWDERSGATHRIVAGGIAQARHAARLHLPVVNAGDEERKRRRFVTVQPFLYGKCLEKAEPSVFGGMIADYCYVILGKTPENVVVWGSAEDQGEFEAVRRDKIVLADHVNLALDTARTAIRRIRGNFFWPPGPSEEWRWDVRDVLTNSPERDFPCGTAWRDAQEAKLDGLDEEARA